MVDIKTDLIRKIEPQTTLRGNFKKKILHKVVGIESPPRTKMETSASLQNILDKMKQIPAVATATSCSKTIMARRAMRLRALSLLQ